MKKEIFFLAFFLGVMQRMFAAYFLNQSKLYTVACISFVSLLLCVLGLHMFTIIQNRSSAAKKPTNIYKKKSPSLFSRISLVWQKYIFVLSLFLTTICAIFVANGSLPVITLTGTAIFSIVSTIVVYQAIRKKNIYFHNYLFLYKDYLVPASFLALAGSIYLFHYVDTPIQLFLSSILVLIFLSIFSPKKKVFRRRSRKLSLITGYILLFILSGIASAISIYSVLDTVIVRGIGDKVDFINIELHRQGEEICKSVTKQLFLTNTSWCLSSDQKTNDSTTTIPTVPNFSGEKLGEITNTGDIGTNNLSTGKTIKTTNASGLLLSSNTDTQITSGENTIKKTPQGSTKAVTETTIHPNTPQTYRQVLKHLFNDPTLLTDQKPELAFVSFEDPDYLYFATAHAWSMIGKKIMPDAIVRCNTYLVMKGIRRGRPVKVRNKKDPFTPYRKKAQKLGEENNCGVGQQVTFGSL